MIDTWKTETDREIEQSDILQEPKTYKEIRLWRIFLWKLWWEIIDYFHKLLCWRQKTLSKPLRAHYCWVNTQCQRENTLVSNNMRIYTKKSGHLKKIKVRIKWKDVKFSSPKFLLESLSELLSLITTWEDKLYWPLLLIGIKTWAIMRQDILSITCN